jgi:hypothetical protein
MAANKTIPATQSSLKKKMVNEVSLQLKTALPKLKELIGEKKFDKRIRKAAKLLTTGIKDGSPAKDKVEIKTKIPLKAAVKIPVKSPVKKAAKKKSQK